MQRRVLAAIILVALALQGPVVAYSNALGPLGVGSTGSPLCSVQNLSLTECDLCCSQGSGPSCSASCVLSIGAALPAMQAPVIPKARSVAIPDRGATPFIEHDPALLLRPPIV